MILLIGEGENEFMSKYLLNHLQDKQVDVIWIDQNSLPVENTITLYSSKGQLKGNICFHDQITIDLDKFQSIYTRISFMNTDIILSPGQKEFMEAERSIALDLWLEHTDALVVNSARSQRSNGSKLYQSWIVKQYGFQVPQSLVTNSPAKARSFIEEHKEKGIIYKSASSERSKVAKITENDLDRLENLAFCPTLFQTYVPGVDIRIHTLATGETFATEITSQTSDYRYDAERSVKAIEIPESLKQTCINLTRDLGLYLSGIDTRRTPDGDYYCFEVNPSPAFAWYEDLSGQPITEAVANLLILGKKLVESGIVQRKF